MGASVFMTQHRVSICHFPGRAGPIKARPTMPTSQRTNDQTKIPGSTTPKAVSLNPRTAFVHPELVNGYGFRILAMQLLYSSCYDSMIVLGREPLLLSSYRFLSHLGQKKPWDIQSPRQALNTITTQDMQDLIN